MMAGNNPGAFDSSVEHDLCNTWFGSELLSRFVLGNRLCHNDTTSLYMLTERATNEKYVLKAIARSSFSVDLDVLKMIDHPGIARIAGSGITEKYIYIIKAFISGMTLDKYVEGNGPFSEEAAVGILRQICGVLKYFHGMKNPIIYRDLKPANIILTQDGSIKLFDLDSIRLYKDASKKDTIFLGTEGYAAPEQFGFSQTDVRTDIYTIGTTLYYLLTGRVPTINDFRLEDIRKYRTDLSDSICRIIKKCTMFSPEYRYQSIAELEQEISYMYGHTRATDGPAVAKGKRLRPDGAGEPGGIRFVVRSVAMVLAVAAVFTVLLAVGDSSRISESDNGHASGQATARPPVFSSITSNDETENQLKTPMPVYRGDDKAGMTGERAGENGEIAANERIYSIDSNVYYPGGIRRLVLNETGEYSDIEYSFNQIHWYEYTQPLDFAGSLYIHIRYRRPGGDYMYKDLFITLDDYNYAEKVETGGPKD